MRGFVTAQAATSWVPPTARQLGLIGMAWSKGWIIEKNVISHSRCCGIALGKYGDEWDNRSDCKAEGDLDTGDTGWFPGSAGEPPALRHSHQLQAVGRRKPLARELLGAREKLLDSRGATKQVMR